jgi:hypothetical protein
MYGGDNFSGTYSYYKLTKVVRLIGLCCDVSLCVCVCVCVCVCARARARVPLSESSKISTVICLPIRTFLCNNSGSLSSCWREETVIRRKNKINLSGSINIVTRNFVISADHLSLL